MPAPRLLVALLMGLASSGCSSKAPPDPFWVGHLAQTSGADKARGMQSQRAVRLAAEEPSAANLRVTNRPVAVRHVDTHGDAETTRAEGVRLIAVNKAIALLVDADPAQTERLGREAQPYGVPVLVCGELASLPGENVFVLGAGAEARGRALARFAAEDLQIPSIAVLSDSNSALAAALAGAFVRKAGKRVTQEAEFLNEQQFKERVSRLSRDKPGAVFFAGSTADLRRLRAELAAAELRVPVLFGGADGSAMLIGDEAKDGPDLFYATAFTPKGASAKGRDFIQHFQEMFGERPDVAAALSYDATQLLYEAIRQGNSVSSSRIREQLAKIESFESVTGALSFKERQARRPVFVMRLKDGAATLEKTVPAEA